MSERTICSQCDQPLALPDKWVMDSHGNDDDDLPTMVQHYQETGHIPVTKPTITGCHRCGNMWWYSSDKKQATCPNCKSTTGVGTIGSSYADEQIEVCGAD